MELVILNQPADQMPGTAVIALFFQEHKPLVGPAALLDWRLDGKLTRLLLDGKLSGRAGEHLVVQNNGKLRSDWVLLVGGGQWYGLSEATYAALLQHSILVAAQAGFLDISLCVAPHPEAGADALTAALRQTLATGTAGAGESLLCRLSCLT